MRNTNRWVRRSSLGAATALLLGGTAPAQEQLPTEGEPQLSIDDSAGEGFTVGPDPSCFKMCSGESGTDDCRLDAHESKQLCIDGNGCEALRGAYHDACFGENRDTAACDEARARFRDCVRPCDRAFRAQLGSCQDRMATCLEEKCGIEPPKALDGRVLRYRFAP
jgi:hypothetical protein